MLDKDNDGEHAPLLLFILDLSHWTAILYVSTLDNGVEKAMARLKEAHAVLANLLEKDEINLEEATNNTRVVEAALRAANPQRTGRIDCLLRRGMRLLFQYTQFWID